MSNRVEQAIQRLRRELSVNKGKSGVLAGLVLILCVVVGRVLTGGGGAADTAVADPTPVVSANATPPNTSGEIPRVVVPERNISTVQSQPGWNPHATSGVEHHADLHWVSIDGLPRELARDPFRSRSWLAMLAAANDEAEGAGAASRPSWLERLSRRWSDYQSRIDAAEQLVDERLASLTLQSTMIGQAKAAYISGRLVHEGDEINGFSVVHIEWRRVTLAQAGVTRTLTVP